jgi:hypothetical protein
LIFNAYGVLSATPFLSSPFVTRGREKLPELKIGEAKGRTCGVNHYKSICPNGQKRLPKAVFLLILKP